MVLFGDHATGFVDAEHHDKRAGRFSVGSGDLCAERIFKVGESVVSSP